MGSQLADIVQHSWHVDVVCPTAGWLGTYRPSRETGLWFGVEALGHGCTLLAGRSSPHAVIPFRPVVSLC